MLRRAAETPLRHARHEVYFLSIFDGDFLESRPLRFECHWHTIDIKHLMILYDDAVGAVPFAERTLRAFDFASRLSRR